MRTINCDKSNGRAVLLGDDIPYTIAARIVYVYSVGFEEGFPTREMWEWRPRKASGVQYVPDGIEEGAVLAFCAKDRRGRDCTEREELFSVVTQVVDSPSILILNVEDCESFQAACALAYDVRAKGAEDKAERTIETECGLDDCEELAF